MAAALRPCRAPLATLARIDRLAAQRPPQNVTLNELQERMAKTSKTATPAAFVREARWLQEELPLRMAQLLADFNRLPFVALRCEPLADVWSIYWQELEALSALPRAESSDHVVRLKDELLLSQERRSGVIEAFRQAVGELRRFPDVQSSLEAFLDKAAR
ncbi:unnamed protein product [Prorocentrum cordatum]|uniref:Protein-serine/threonine kinase n=1 Tax=Prorocentrum cordatum TaxID=2364126 RepID=A0ABN9VLI7_9DINO|nr:unnamed protein product [Polarella glacialis]